MVGVCVGQNDVFYPSRIDIQRLNLAGDDLGGRSGASFDDHPYFPKGQVCREGWDTQLIKVRRDGQRLMDSFFHVVSPFLFVLHVRLPKPFFSIE
jgi:hypothetical protein